MKQRVLILFWLIPAAFVSAESGEWELNPRIIELPGGLILDPEAPGAVEYRGITALRFLREDLAVAEVSGRQFSAFYQTVEGEARGLRIELRFKDDKLLSLNLTKKADDRYLYLYRVCLWTFFPPPWRISKKNPPSHRLRKQRFRGKRRLRKNRDPRGWGKCPRRKGVPTPPISPTRGRRLSPSWCQAR